MFISHTYRMEFWVKMKTNEVKVDWTKHPNVKQNNMSFIMPLSYKIGKQTKLAYNVRLHLRREGGKNTQDRP